jgi:NAD(P)-dependent dehydrogenase (short-subunit alcohol dehydrogenase family)
MNDMTSTPVALVTGASQGLGRALTRSLVQRGWRVVVDGRDAERLRAVADPLATVAVPGDVTDPDHRDALAAATRSLGRLDLVVNNASDLGPSPMPSLAAFPLDDLRTVYETNVVAPVALLQVVLSQLRASAGTVLNISSDAAVEPYADWGGYGSSKAALDQVSAILAAEEPALRIYAVDPGDMHTEMHQRAFPGEDISDRPRPETVVPALLRLLDVRPASGRYRAADWAVAESLR